MCLFFDVMMVFVCRSTNQVLLLTAVVRNTCPNFKAKYVYYVIGSRMYEVISAVDVEVQTRYHKKGDFPDKKSCDALLTI